MYRPGRQRHTTPEAPSSVPPQVRKEPSTRWPPGGRQSTSLSTMFLKLFGRMPALPLPVASVPLPSLAEARLMLAELAEHRSDYYRAPYPYLRDSFGPAWYDFDANGRTTRNDVLAAQLRNVTLTGDHLVAAGTLHEPYRGATVRFVRQFVDFDQPRHKTDDLVVIDHVVSIWEAWAAGAWAWTDDERLAFANDPINLLATTYSINEEKGPLNIARWHPDNPASVCEVALRVIATKHKYQLEIHAADRQYLERTLKLCR